MEIVKLTGTIEVLTGLRIGGGDDVMQIGGIDNPVIKETNSGNPYIPGSSLKGKMRSLLEWDCGLVPLGDGKPADSSLVDKLPEGEKQDKARLLLKLFGDHDAKSKTGITRISVGDCKLSDREGDNAGLKLTEAKYENTIDRKSGTASNPRQTERVPVGVKFVFDIRIKILEEDKDDEEAMISMVKRGMELVEQDYLGGNGSRGYGRVIFHHDAD